LEAILESGWQAKKWGGPVLSPPNLMYFARNKLRSPDRKIQNLMSQNVSFPKPCLFKQTPKPQRKQAQTPFLPGLKLTLKMYMGTVHQE